MLFTDIEGSTRLLQQLGRERYAEALELHRLLLREAFAASRGYEVDCEGDAFFVAFNSAEEAVAAATQAQKALASVEWPEKTELRVRMGLHTGEPLAVPPKYVGLDVHRAARVMAAGHGGQILISQTTRDLLGEGLPVRDLGEHRLKDLSQSQRLYQLEIGSGRSEFPPLNTLENRPTNLPVQATPLVGRHHELAELQALLARDEVRLLTLTGTGGTGKTRLALHLAADVLDGFPNGVFFVNLASIFDPSLVVPTIAQTLGLRERPSESPDETLREHLRDAKMLLLLDNFEQVLAAATDVASLMVSASRLKVVVTSRTPLNLSGEWTYDVPPLPVPSEAVRRPESLAQYDAVALFIQRAQAVKRDFAVSSENAPAIAEICVRLDGLPLALELAAARIRTLPPKTLLARLEQKLQILTGGARDHDARQQTLRATIEWSYNLLTDPEQALFARLGVFVGGCRLEAVEAVGEPNELGLDGIDGAASLVENSLVRQKADSDGEPRFWMLEAIREYALNRLAEGGDEEQIRSRHRAHFERVGAEIAQAIFSADDAAAAARFDEDSGNIRAALAHSIEARDADVATRLCNAYSGYLYIRGGAREQLAWADQVLALEPGTDRNARRRLLCVTAELAAANEDMGKASRLLDEAVEIANDLNDPRLLASVYGFQGHLAIAEAKFERACALYEETLRIELEIEDGDDVGLAYDHSNLGWGLALAEDVDRAETVLLEGLRIAERSGAQRPQATLLLNLAHVALIRSDFDAATSLARDALRRSQEFADPRVLDEGFRVLARSAAASDAGARSARLLGAADALDAAGPREVALLPRQDLIDRARQRLGPVDWAEHYAAGRTMPRDEAIAFALAAE
jgi:predicted ATPase/class 3 adenylate cyclase